MYFKQQLFLLARRQYYDQKLFKSTEKRFTSQIILNQINIEVKNKFYNFIKEVMALALQHDKTKPFEEITQVTERPAFANPISKATFEALPKIYGRAKKKKYLAKYQTQRKQPQQTQLKTRQNHQRFSLLNRPSTNKISAHDDSHNKLGKSEKRFKTQMKSFDKNYALQLSRPKNGFCSKKNCFCGQQHNCDHNKSIQKLQVKLQPVRKIKLPQIQKGIELEDVESKHKVSLATIERNQRQMNSSRKPFTLLDLLKSSQRKAKPSLEQNEKLQNKSNKTERQIIRKEVEVQFPLKTQCAAVQTEIEASAEQEDYKRKTQPLGSLLPNKTGRKVESSQSNRINKRQIQTSNPSKTSKIAEEIAEDKQKLKFKQMKAKQMQIEVIESQSEDGRSIRSSISSASLSKYVFQNAKKTNTMFQALKNKQTSSVKDQKAMNQSKVKTNNNKFVYQKKNGLFVIPEEDQYVSYLKNYESMNEKFKIKNLVRKPNFKVVKQEEGIYFGQFTDQIKNGKGIMVTDRNIFEGHYKDDLKTYGCQRNIDGVYKGEFLNGIREGFGSFEWNNGQIFEGEWKNGTKNGYGIWKSPKGDYYEGNWLLNRQHGKGIYKHKISTYRGYFVQFLKDGQGEEFFVNGDKYVGHYKKGKPNGFGKYQWADGSYYEGEFLNGVRQGRGKWVYSNGTVYEGEFKDDFKEGYGKQTYKSGERFEGTFVKGARSEGSLYDMHKKQIRISQSD